MGYALGCIICAIFIGGLGLIARDAFVSGGLTGRALVMLGVLAFVVAVIAAFMQARKEMAEEAEAGGDAPGAP